MVFCFSFFFFKQKTAYEMRISDWSSDVCSSDLLIPLLTLLLALQAPVRAQEPAPAGGDSAVERGRYIFDAAGCLGCHTDIKGGGQRLAGGRALETPFGTFYPPNITPDHETGIGAWSEEAFAAALREGTSPDRKSTRLNSSH